MGAYDAIGVAGSDRVLVSTGDRSAGFPAAPASESSPDHSAHGSRHPTAYLRPGMRFRIPCLSAHRLNLPSISLRLYSRLRPGPVLSISSSRTHTSIKSITMPAYKTVPGADQFYPLNEPAIGTAYPEVRDSKLAIVAASLTITGLTECLPAECPATHSVPTFDYQRCNLQEQNLCRTHSISHMDNVVSIV